MNGSPSSITPPSTTAPAATAPRGTAPRPLVDFRDPVEAANAQRIAAAWHALRRGAVTTTLREHFFGHPDVALEPGQYDTLDKLVRRDGWRMSELADALRVDPSTATRAVQRLVNDGLAERRPSADDGRVVMVYPSAEGTRRHHAAARRRAKTMQRLLAVFDAGERSDLADLLDRFVGALDELVDELHGERAACQSPSPAGVAVPEDAEGAVTADS